MSRPRRLASDPPVYRVCSEAEVVIMTRLAAVLALLASLGCASSQSVGRTSTIYTEKDRLWMATQSAIQDIGGRIVISNRSTGTVVGRLEVEGTPVDLTVSISGSPAPDAPLLDYWDVNVRGSLVGESEPDEEWQRRLRYFEEQVIERINVSVPRPIGRETAERPTKGLLGPASPGQPPG
jgi:hypothetical protein